MPAFSVYVDESHVATVSTEHLFMMDIRVGGSRFDEDFVTLDVAGMQNTTDTEGTYLEWVHSLVLSPGTSVRIHFLEAGETTLPGKTLDELFPDEPDDSPQSFELTPEIQAELQSRPILRDKYRFQVTTAQGVSNGETRGDAWGFNFSVVWNMYRPERARVSLTSSSLEQLLEQKNVDTLVEERLGFGGSATLVVSD